MSITIIGCGWLGFPLGKELVNLGYSVHGSVRSEGKFDALNEANINPFTLDLKESTSVSHEIIESTEVLIISIPPLYRDESKKFGNILRELLNQFSEKTRVIFTSSTGIYPQATGNFDESFEFNAKQESSVLNIAEDAIRNSEKAHVIFRLGGLIGPNRHPIRFIQGRENVKNPEGPINFVHQGDCIRAIVEATENKGMNGTFNLVFPDHPKRKNYYVAAAKHYNLEAPSFKQEEAVDRIISSEKIIQKAAFQFEFPIDEFPKLNLN